MRSTPKKIHIAGGGNPPILGNPVLGKYLNDVKCCPISSYTIGLPDFVKSLKSLINWTFENKNVELLKKFLDKKRYFYKCVTLYNFRS